MPMKNVRTLLGIVFFLATVVSPLISQQESVILYNSQPVKVVLSGDKIISFVGTVPDYMNGYDLERNDIKIIADNTSDPVMTDEVRNAEYAILSTERVMLEYESAQATLDRAAIADLNEISAKMKKDPQVKLLLTGHYISTSKVSQVTNDNRIASIKTYLSIKGIDESRIEVGNLESEALQNTVAINFLK